MAVLERIRAIGTARLDGAGAIEARFTYATRGNAPSFVTKLGEIYCIIFDHLGSLRLAISATSGHISQDIRYEPFGNMTLNSNVNFQPFSFGGGIADDHTKLVRFGARDYDPLSGRWTKSDPAIFAEEETNSYRYASGNPVNFIDLNGLWDIFVFGELDGVIGSGREVSGGLVYDTDTPMDSGIFVAPADYLVGPKALDPNAWGLNAGGGLGGGFVWREIDGAGSSIDLNLWKFSPSFLFDDQGFQGIAISLGPGMGVSYSEGGTSVLKIRDVADLLHYVKDSISDRLERFRWNPWNRAGTVSCAEN